MTRFTIKLVLLAALVCVLPATAEEGGMDPAAMEAWMKAATPGEFHEFLGKKTGSWKIAGKMWMAPGGDPVTSESKAESKMILGGRYLYETMEGVTMGMPFEGLGITGYNNATKVVTSIWYDNLGTVTTVLEGEWAKPGDPLELHGEMFDPMSGMDTTIRTVTTFVSVDESVFEYFVTMEGMPEMKVMELKYTRAK